MPALEGLLRGTRTVPLLGNLPSREGCVKEADSGTQWRGVREAGEVRKGPCPETGQCDQAQDPRGKASGVVGPVLWVQVAGPVGVSWVSKHMGQRGRA